MPMVAKLTRNLLCPGLPQEKCGEGLLANTTEPLADPQHPFNTYLSSACMTGRDSTQCMLMMGSMLCMSVEAFIQHDDHTAVTW